MQPRRGSRRRLIGVIAIVAILLVGVVGAVAVTGDDSDDPPEETARPVTAALTGTVVAEEGTVLPISATAATYHVTYQVETASGTTALLRTEDISVRRPFDAQLLAYSEGGSSAAPDLDARSNLGLYADVTDPDHPDVGQGMPAAALGDLRFDGALDDLVDAGIFVVRERRELLGRECQVYRTGNLVESPPLALPTESTYADVCIDSAGLVLEEVAFVDGIAETYEVATAVQVDTSLDDDLFTIVGEPLTLDEGGNELGPLDTAEVPVANYWVPAAAPLGATHVGRYVLRTPNPEAAGDTGTSTTVGPSDPAGKSIDTYVDVYTTGPTFVVVHQGIVSAATTRDTTLGKDVEAGALGTARVVFGATGSTLVASNDTWFVEVTAPLSVADLGAIASTLQPVTANA
jgi:hypothetical protein